MPQLAVLPLQFPELVDTDTLYVPATGLLHVGTPVQLRPLLTVVDVLLLPLQVTVGGVIAVPSVPEVGTLAQVSVYVTGAATVNVPLQVAVLPLQFPELADTDTSLYVPAAGLLQVGAPVQLRPLLTAVPLQVTVGGVIGVPTVPDEGTLAQASVYVMLELLLGKELLELEELLELLLDEELLDEELLELKELLEELLDEELLELKELLLDEKLLDEERLELEELLLDKELLELLFTTNVPLQVADLPLQSP